MDVIHDTRRILADRERPVLILRHGVGRRRPARTVRHIRSNVLHTRQRSRERAIQHSKHPAHRLHRPVIRNRRGNRRIPHHRHRHAVIHRHRRLRRHDKRGLRKACRLQIQQSAVIVFIVERAGPRHGHVPVTIHRHLMIIGRVVAVLGQLHTLAPRTVRPDRPGHTLHARHTRHNHAHQYPTPQLHRYHSHAVRPPFPSVTTPDRLPVYTPRIASQPVESTDMSVDGDVPPVGAAGRNVTSSVRP